MSFTKKIDRARQWAGEKMGAEIKTTQSDEFQALEAEMTVRQNAVESLHKSASVYVKWVSRRCDTSEDKARSTPTAALGRSMTAHGNDFDPGSEFGNCLAHVGRANERLGDIQASYADDATTTWLQHLERSVAMMKDYQAARKKLESRRLAYDASLAKMQKSKRDDFRVEDEMRVCKTKYDDSTEDVLRRMQDIKDAEADNVGALTSFLDAELDYHERAADELRRARHSLVELSSSAPAFQDELHVPRARSSPTRSRNAGHQTALAVAQVPERMSTRRLASQAAPLPPAQPQSPRPSMMRASTYGVRSASSAVPTTSTRAPRLARNTTDIAAAYGSKAGDDVFTDDESAGSDGASPGWGTRSISSTTSHDSLARVNSLQATKKAAPPPPPPVNRAKKPPPPVPARRANLGY